MFVDRGDFFFGTDFEGVDSWGKRNSRALGTFSVMTRDGFDDLDPFSAEADADTLDNGLETRLWAVPLLGGIAIRTISHRVLDIDHGSYHEPQQMLVNVETAMWLLCPCQVVKLMAWCRRG